MLEDILADRLDHFRATGECGDFVQIIVALLNQWVEFGFMERAENHLFHDEGGRGDLASVFLACDQDAMLAEKAPLTLFAIRFHGQPVSHRFWVAVIVTPSAFLQRFCSTQAGALTFHLLTTGHLGDLFEEHR